MIKKILVGLLIFTSFFFGYRAFAQDWQDLTKSDKYSLSAGASDAVSKQPEPGLQSSGCRLVQALKNTGFDPSPIVTKLLSKGYINRDYEVSLNFNGFDAEFMSWFPDYTPEDFNKIKNMLLDIRDHPADFKSHSHEVVCYH